MRINQLLYSVALILLSGCFPNVPDKDTVGSARPPSGVLVVEAVHPMRSLESDWEEPRGSRLISRGGVATDPRNLLLSARDTGKLYTANPRLYHNCSAIEEQVYLTVSPHGHWLACAAGQWLLLYKTSDPKHERVLRDDVLDHYWAHIHFDYPVAFVKDDRVAVIVVDRSCPQGDAFPAGRVIVLDVTSNRVVARGACAMGVAASDGHLALQSHRTPAAGSEPTFSLDNGKTWIAGRLATLDGDGDPYTIDDDFALRDKNGDLSQSNQVSLTTSLHERAEIGDTMRPRNG